MKQGAAMTIDTAPRRRSAHRARQQPFRQERTPEPLVLPVDADPLLVAAAIAGRIREIGRARSCCGIVFIKPDRKVYVLSEESSMAHRWVEQFPEAWVGCYGGWLDEAAIEGLISDMEGML